MGSGAQTITSNGKSFSNVAFNAPGGTYTLQDNLALTGNWVMAAGTFAGGASTVSFAGAANSSSTLTGSTTFYNLSVKTAIKFMLFAGGSTTTLNGLFTSSGTAGNYAVLKSTSTGTSGSLANNGTNNVLFSSATDSDARTGHTITCTNNCGNLGNNFNWNFGGGGITRTWLGSVDTNWSNSLNWDTVAPFSSQDSALIVTTAARMPVLTAPVTISTLTIQSGTATVTLNGFALTASSITNAGNFIFNGTEAVSSAPNNLAGSTVTYGATSGIVPLLSTWTYQGLNVSGIGGTFQATGAVTASTLTIANGASFSLNGSSLTVSSFTNAGNFQFIGTEAVSSAPNNVAGSTVTYTATSGTILFLSTWTYRYVAVNVSGGTFMLSGPTTFYGLTVPFGASFVQGTNNNLIIRGNLNLAPGTFTKDTGTGTLQILGNSTVTTNNQDLGNVILGP